MKSYQRDGFTSWHQRDVIMNISSAVYMTGQLSLRSSLLCDSYRVSPNMAIARPISDWWLGSLLVPDQSCYRSCPPVAHQVRSELATAMSISRKGPESYLLERLPVHAGSCLVLEGISSR